MKKMKRFVKIMVMLIFILMLEIQDQKLVFASNVDGLSGDNVSMNVVADGETDDTTSQNQVTDEATGVDAMVAILGSNPEDATEPLTVRPEYTETTYTKDIEFPQSTLNGIFSSAEVYFYVPDYWETEYVYAEIQYNLSQLIEDVVSSMTFSINGIPIESCKVSYNKGNTQIIYVKIPIEFVKEGYNSFSLATYARLYDAVGCSDDFSGANWCSIADTSYVRCGYEVKEDEHKVADYPYPFMSTIEDNGKGLAIAVSDKATNAELEAAMNLMADLSTETDKNNLIQFCLLSDLPDIDPTRTILVANYDNLPQEYKDLLIGVTVDEEHAVVSFVEDSKNDPMLIVTSLNDSCLLEAAYMLMDEDRVSQERSNIAVVNLGSAELVSASHEISTMIADNYTIDDIIGSGLFFYGPFHQEQAVYLPFSENYFLSDAGKVSLQFRYSENLDFTRSMITVYWGNVPIASKKLEKEMATGDTLTFAIPADVVGTTAGSIRIAFDLEIKDLICTARQDQMPWAYVSEESSFYLPLSAGQVVSFDQKPLPFRVDGKFDDCMLVIPEEPTTEELNLFAQVVGMYGESVSPYGDFYVKRVSEFDESDADYNIITVGTFENNALIQSLNANLHFSYNEANGNFLSNEQLILSDAFASEIAIFQLLESPYAMNRGILAITGANDESLNNAQEFLRDDEKRISLSKDCVILDSDFNIRTFQFIEEATESEQPSMFGVLANSKQSLLFTIIATSVMLLILIAISIVLIRIRMYHKSGDN